MTFRNSAWNISKATRTGSGYHHFLKLVFAFVLLSLNACLVSQPPDEGVGDPSSASAATADKKKDDSTSDKSSDDTSKSADTTTPPPATPPATLPDGGSRPPGTFPVCLNSTRPTGISTATIDVDVPAGFDGVEVTLNGIMMGGDTGTGVKAIDVFGLAEGATYLVKCFATWQNPVTGAVFRVEGTNRRTIQTLSVNPPIFTGIASLTTINSQSMIAVWQPALGGPPVAQFKLFCSPGSTVDWSATPVATAINTVFTAQIDGRGEGMPYTCGVRACSSGGVCDVNTATRSSTLLDGGAPQTVGATSGSFVNGEVILTAPWDHTLGRVQNRRIYSKIGGGASTNIASYSLVRTVSAASADSVPTTFAINETMTTIPENQTMYFIVRDEDERTPAQVNQNTNVVSVVIGDRTPPTFGGITDLRNGTPGDTVLRAHFDAISADVAWYRFNLTTAVGSADPTDPCLAPAPYARVANTDFPSSGPTTYDVAGLAERTKYAVCVKAEDASGNISKNTGSYIKTTQDITPPVFDGVQALSYDNVTASIRVQYNPSVSADRASYRVQLWYDDAPGVVSSFSYSSALYPNQVYIPSSSFSVVESKTVVARVDAGDDAAPTYNTAPNYTATTGTRSVVIPDISPPPGFGGINIAVPLGLDGQVQVGWVSPANWTEYAGFKVYRATPANVLTELKDCPCVSVGCPDRRNSCDLTLPNARESMNFFVRAYDAFGNQTAVPTQSFNNSIPSFTGDATPPLLVSNIAAAWVPAGARVGISWNAASDNQFSGTNGNGTPNTNTITYTLYRNTVAFTPALLAANNPDGTQIASQTVVGFNDVGPFSQGARYYYTVCATDSNGNKKCDGNTTSVVIPDAVAPVVTTPVVTYTYISPTLINYNLVWDISDNVDADSSLNVKIYRKIGAISATDWPATNAGNLVPGAAGNGNGIEALVETNIPNSVTQIITYVLLVTDLGENPTTVNFAVFSPSYPGLSNLVSVPGSSSSLDATFASQAAATSIVIYCAERGGTTYAEVAQAAPTSTTHRVTGLKSGTTYTCKAQPRFGTTDLASSDFRTAQTNSVTQFGYQGPILVRAYGPASYAPPGTPTAAQVDIVWKQFSNATGSTSYRVLRTLDNGTFDVTTSASCTSGTTETCVVCTVSSGLGNKTCTDSNVAASPRKYDYTIVNVNSGQVDELPVGNVDPYRIRVPIPPANMVLVQRDAVNFEMCTFLGRTPDPLKRQRCAYTGHGATTSKSDPARSTSLGLEAGFYDFGYNLFVDRWEAGCAYSGSNFGSGTPAAAGITGSDGERYYDYAAGRCYLKIAGAWSDLATVPLNNPALPTVYTNAATPGTVITPPIAFVNQPTAYAVCRGNVDPDYGPKRLLRRREFVATAAWPLISGDANVISDTQARDREAGLLQRTEFSCNSNRLTGLLAAEVGSTWRNNAENMKRSTGDTTNPTAMLGSKWTRNCVSRFGAQDMIGNFGEWTSDQFSPRASRIWDGTTSPLDNTNNDLVGYALDGVIGPGNTPTGNSVVNYASDQTSPGFSIANFSAPLGLPFVSNNGGQALTLSEVTSPQNRVNNDAIGLYVIFTLLEPRGMSNGGARDALTGAGRWALDVTSVPTKSTDPAIGFRCGLAAE